MKVIAYNTNDGKNYKTYSYVKIENQTIQFFVPENIYKVEPLVFNYDLSKSIKTITLNQVNTKIIMGDKIQFFIKLNMIIRNYT